MAPPFYPSADLPASSESMLNRKHYSVTYSFYSFTIEHYDIYISVEQSFNILHPRILNIIIASIKYLIGYYIPPWDTRSTRRGCWPHRTSSRDIDARNNPWSAVSLSEVTSGRSCTLQLVWTENILPPHPSMKSTCVSGLFRCEVVTLCNT